MDRGEESTRGRGRLRTLPLNLLLGDRLCLVVGAGGVALRKVTNLLAHGARVVVAAPDAVPGVRALEAEGCVAMRCQGYDVSLLAELRPFLVYAATDDDDLNRRIVQEARATGALATSVTCWEAGDFITPAVVPWGTGQVSITTEGTSCRQARFLRLRLEELLGGDGEYVAWRVQRERLSSAEYERVWPGSQRRAELVAMLRHLPALEEFVLGVTDDRWELHAWARRSAGLDAAVRRLLGVEALGDRVELLVAADVDAGPGVHAALAQAIGDGVAADHLQRLLAEPVEVSGD